MLSAAVVLCCASAAEAQPLTAHRTGEFQAVLTQRSPESDPSRWVESFQFGCTLDRWNYDLSAESFILGRPAYSTSLYTVSRYGASLDTLIRTPTPNESMGAPLATN